MKGISSRGSLSMATCNDYANFILATGYFNPFPKEALGKKDNFCCFTKRVPVVWY